MAKQRPHAYNWLGKPLFVPEQGSEAKDYFQVFVNHFAL